MPIQHLLQCILCIHESAPLSTLAPCAEVRRVEADEQWCDWLVCILQNGKSSHNSLTCGIRADWDPAVSNLGDLYKPQIQEYSVTRDDLRLELQRRLDILKPTSCVRETGPMYGAFVDDVCLGYTLDPSAKDIHCAMFSEELLENTFLGGLELSTAWLTVLFCCHM